MLNSRRHRRVLSAAIALLLAGCAGPSASPIAVSGSAAPAAPGATDGSAPAVPAAPGTYRPVEINGYAAIGSERLAGYSVEAFDALSGAPLPVVASLAETPQAGPAAAYELRAGGAGAPAVRTDGQGRFRLSVAGTGHTAVVVMVSQGPVRLRAVLDAGEPPQDLAVTAGSTVAAGQVQQLALAMGAIQDAGHVTAMQAAGYAVRQLTQTVDAQLHQALLDYHAGLAGLSAGVDNRFNGPNPPHNSSFPEYFGNRSSDTADRAIADLSQALAFAVVATSTGTGEAKTVDPSAAMAFLRQADPAFLPKLAWRLAHTGKSAGAEESAQAMANGILFLDGRPVATPAGTGAFVAQVYQALVRAYPTENTWLSLLAAKPAQRRVLQQKTSADFTDLQGLDTALKTKIDALLAKGVFEGTSDSNFGINDNMTRAQFAKVMTLVYGLNTSNDTPSTSSFSDIPSDGWSLPYIEAAKKAGLIDGMSDSTFNPRQSLITNQVQSLVKSSQNLPQVTNFQANLPGTNAGVQSKSNGNGQPQVILLNTQTGATQPVNNQDANTPGGLESVVNNAIQNLHLDPPSSNSSGGSHSGATQAPAPTITSVTPNNGMVGTAITIAGTNFRAGATVTIGGMAATGVSVASATSITATVPAGLAAGSHDIVVTNSDTTSVTSVGAYTVTASPTITSVTPNSGVVGTAITIAGTNFRAGATVTIGGMAATGVSVASATSITATVPAGLAVGSHDIVVTNSDTTSVTSVGAYTVPAPPTITSVTPNNGMVGTAITIAGTNFRAGATVTIGGMAATGVSVASATSITATVPAGLAAAAQNVTVTNTDTTSVTSVGAYTVTAGLPAPTITSISPDGTFSGLWVQGQPFTIFGTNFRPGATVTLGGTDIPGVTVTSTQIDGTVPGSFASGTHTLVVTNTDNNTNDTYGSTVTVP